MDINQSNKTELLALDDADPEVCKRFMEEFLQERICYCYEVAWRCIMQNGVQKAEYYCPACLKKFSEDK